MQGRGLTGRQRPTCETVVATSGQKAPRAAGGAATSVTAIVAGEAATGKRECERLLGDEGRVAVERSERRGGRVKGVVRVSYFGMSKRSGIDQAAFEVVGALAGNLRRPARADSR